MGVPEGDCWDDPQGPQSSDMLFDHNDYDFAVSTSVDRGDEIYSGAEDVPYDGIDADCGGDSDFDFDDDGYLIEGYPEGTRMTLGVVGVEETMPVGDCDDLEPSTHPSASEFCDGVDNDCDGTVDNPGYVQDGPDVSVAEVYVDNDGDGYGDANYPYWVCEDQIPTGYVNNADDCDDSDASLNPNTVWYADSDNDGYGDHDDIYVQCNQPSGNYILTDGDCDDSRSDVNPGEIEICDPDNIDEDCSGTADDDDASVDPSTQYIWWRDADVDGFGTSSDEVVSCDQPVGYVLDLNGEDCDDAQPDVNPIGTELCDGKDNDCNGLIDDNPVTNAIVYYDGDSDGYGDASNSLELEECNIPANYVSNSSDCDDSTASINPAATEVCNGSDDDCDYLTDDDDSSLDTSTTTAWYTDQDNDGFGDATSVTNSCDQPSGTVTDNTDCDDADAAINPNTQWFADNDSDTYGDATTITTQCTQPSGFVLDDQDCDDTNASINPAATEVCDAANTDEDCNGIADDNDSGVEPTTQTLYYADDDNDGYGDPATPQAYCDQPSGLVTDNTDCDDSENHINPDTEWFADSDNDGYGDASSSITQCAEPSGYVLDDQDCDDADQSVNPGETEIPFDGIDNDCDNELPEWDGELDVTLDADAELQGLGSGSLAGHDVHISSDLNSDGYDDLVVGSYGDSTNASGAGAAFIVNGPVSGTTGLGAADGIALGRSANGGLGFVVNTGDLTGNGSIDLLVSEPGYSTYTGGISIYEGPLSGTLNLTAVMSGESLFHYLDDFTLADLNADGQLDLIAGAELADNGGSNTGSVYITYGPLTSNQSAADADVIWSGQAANERFGKDTQPVGDINSDGYDDFMAGAGNASSVATNSGSVYLFMGNVSTDSSVSGAWMTVNGEQSNAQLSLGVSADVTGDGVDDAVYATGQTDFNGSNSGSVYLQQGPLTTGTYYADTDFDRIDGSSSGVELGSSLSVDGDVNGDGINEILVGASGEFSAYLVDGTTFTSGIYFYGSNSSSFGASVSSSGDVNNDGYDDLLFGAPDQGSSTGSVYLVHGDQE